MNEWIIRITCVIEYHYIIAAPVFEVICPKGQPKFDLVGHSCLITTQCLSVIAGHIFFAYVTVLINNDGALDKDTASKISSQTDQ